MRIETNKHNLYIKGVKNGSDSVTLTCSDPISVEIISYTTDLNGDVNVATTGNNTGNVTITYTYSDLYLNGETYSGKIVAKTDFDSLEIPVIINCSDTLIYVNTDNGDGDLTLSYNSLPEVNKVTLVGSTITDISNRLTGEYPNPKTISISSNERYDNRYVIAENGLSQVANEIGSNEPHVDSIYTFEGVYNFNRVYENGGLCMLYTPEVDPYPRGFRGVTNLTLDGISTDYSIGRIRDNLHYNYILLNDYPVLSDVDRTIKFNYSRVDGHAFFDIGSLKEIIRFECPSVDMSSSFQNCTKLTNISGLKNISLKISAESIFSGCTSLTDLSPLSSWDISNVTSMWYTFYHCDSLTDLTPLSNWNTSNVTGLGATFACCTSLTDLTPLSNWNTSNVVSIADMFYRCTSLTDLTPLSNWNTSNMKYFYCAFQNCTSLIDLSGLQNWNTSNVIDMSVMFKDCGSLTDISALGNWSVPHLEDVSNMFENCVNLVDASALGNWSENDIHFMTEMFRGCSKLEKVVLNINYNKEYPIFYTHYMFDNCTSLHTVEFNCDMSENYNNTGMFSNCISLTNLSGFKNISVSLDLRESPLLTHESLMNVINNLAVVSERQILSLHSDSIAKLSDDEIAIATNKGWFIN